MGIFFPLKNKLLLKLYKNVLYSVYKVQYSDFNGTLIGFVLVYRTFLWAIYGKNYL